jgi:hypothetical protein
MFRSAAIQCSSKKKESPLKGHCFLTLLFQTSIYRPLVQPEPLLLAHSVCTLAKRPFKVPIIVTAMSLPSIIAENFGMALPLHISLPVILHTALNLGRAVA